MKELKNLESSEDLLATFRLSAAGIHGAHVSLTGAWREIQRRGDYSPGVSTLLGEACAATALLTANVKLNGRLSVQLAGQGAIKLLFAECTAQGTVRGIATASGDAPEPPDLRGGVLGITIENRGASDGQPHRYQGLVEVVGSSLAEAFEGYFARSEQLPTRMVLACTEEHATGILVQALPDGSRDPEDWKRVCLMLDTVTPQELGTCDVETLVYRLFHEDAPLLTGRKPLAFGCSCSAERVAEMLRALGEAEASAAAADTGEARIHCEFCGAEYRFLAQDIRRLFTATAGGGSGPDRSQ